MVCILREKSHNMQMMPSPAAIVLEDGTVFRGSLVGAPGVAAGEACFTTASTGYEEAATDPSYVAQVLCFAYPLVGNYGVDPARAESERVQAEAVVMRSAPLRGGGRPGRGAARARACAAADRRAAARPPRRHAGAVLRRRGPADRA